MTQRNTTTLVWIGMAIFAYTLPWIVNPGVGMTFGAYDLAEWASLHPQGRTISPTMLTSLLLRFPLVSFMWIVGFSAPSFRSRRFQWAVHALVVVLLALYLLPPYEFFIGALHDVNYQQQFVLALAGIIGGGAGLRAVFPRFHPYIVVGSVLLGSVAALLGVEQANSLMLGLMMPVQRGLGAYLLVMLGGGYLIQSFVRRGAKSTPQHLSTV